MFVPSSSILQRSLFIVMLSYVVCCCVMFHIDLHYLAVVDFAAFWYRLILKFNLIVHCLFWFHTTVSHSLIVYLLLITFNFMRFYLANMQVHVTCVILEPLSFSFHVKMSVVYGLMSLFTCLIVCFSV
jgi:hypothetical protein